MWTVTLLLAAVQVEWTQHVPVDVPYPGKQRAHALAYDSDRQRVVLYSGSALWEWDSAAMAWIARPQAGAPGPRSQHAMAYHAGVRRTLLFGGAQVGSTSADQAALWLWDGTSWTTDSDELVAPP